jgi:hypothetical protein
LKAWRKLLEPLKAENDIRVRLAHHSISQDKEKLEDEVEGIHAYLRPAIFDTRVKSKKLKPLTAVEIVEFSERVGKIHKKLISLLASM